VSHFWESCPHPDRFCTRCDAFCTIPGMTSMTISAARQNLPDAVDKARTEPVILERYGRAAAVLISPEHYARLVAALEDAEDAEAFDAAIAEEGPNIPWDQAKADLGWEWAGTRSSCAPPLLGHYANSIRKSPAEYALQSLCWPRIPVRRLPGRCVAVQRGGCVLATTASSTRSKMTCSLSSSSRPVTAATSTTDDPRRSIRATRVDLNGSPNPTRHARRGARTSWMRS